MQRKLIVFTLSAALLGNALAAGAQERGRKTVIAPAGEEFFIAQGPGAAPAPPHGDNVVFLSAEMSFAGKLVKGAPYSAQAVTEMVQTLADGNRIVRKNTAPVYRDSEGRTRREQTLAHIGPFATSGDTPPAVFINDPVAGAHYVLEPATKTARKLPRMELRFKSEGNAAKAQPGAEGQRKVEVVREQVFRTRLPGHAAGHGVHAAPVPPPPGAEMVAPVEFSFHRHPSKADTKTEKLEPRSFDGVTAEGTRTTTTIAAGEIGNEQPIQIVDEHWYSPELQVVVMRRLSDPRSGEMTYRLTNITRAEPAAALFQVPADYTVRELAPGMRRLRRPAPARQEN